jgi:ferredoxin-NADP reductase
MDADFIKSYAPRAADSDFYICGPEALVETVRKATADLGVPKNRFHDEDFAFHPVSGG